MLLLILNQDYSLLCLIINYIEKMFFLYNLENKKNLDYPPLFLSAFIYIIYLKLFNLFLYI